MVKNNENKKVIPTLEVKEVGFVKEVKKGIAKVGGLPSCIYGQLVEFPNGIKGMVIGFNIEETMVIVFGQESDISVGNSVTTFSELFHVPVGDAFLGRAVNSVCEPIDSKGDITANDHYPVFREAPGVIDRDPLDEAFHTGTKIIDLTIPIGKGQRELIIGDRQTGKTSIALDAIINQKGKDVICIYCWIGGSHTSLENFMQILKERGATDYVIAVCASAAISAAEQYLCPYTAAALGEYFMHKGKDVLIVFDNLTKHAWIYRQMSLLLERAPGREAYPGDIFYLHSQLMERAGKLNAAQGGGTMTFLPIVETLQGDITGYIQTNLISMTDGQIYLNSDLFHEGFKPAIDLGLSVSRVGSKVQTQAIKELGRSLRLQYTQYREMLRLTRLRTRLSDDVMKRIRKGEVLQQLFMQDNFFPVSMVEQIVLFYAFSRNILEVVNAQVLEDFKSNIMEFIELHDPKLITVLEEKPELNNDVARRIDNMFVKYFKQIKEKTIQKDAADR